MPAGSTRTAPALSGETPESGHPVVAFNGFGPETGSVPTAGQLFSAVAPRIAR